MTERFARHVSGPAAPVLMASVSPHGRPRPLLEALGSHLGEKLTVIEIPSIDPGALADLAGADSGPDWSTERLAALTGGRLLTCGIIARRLARGSSLRGALLADMADPGGPLALELRFDYHLLIERTRGHAASRAILNILAREDGLDLTGISRRLRRSAGSTLDYLKWLLEVELLQRRGRRYHFADPLLRLHVLLHEVPERPGESAGRAACIDRFLSSMDSAPVELNPLGRPRSRPAKIRPAEPEPGSLPSPEAPASEPSRRDDFLMEID